VARIVDALKQRIPIRIKLSCDEFIERMLILALSGLVAMQDVKCMVRCKNRNAVSSASALTYGNSSRMTKSRNEIRALARSHTGTAVNVPRVMRSKVQRPLDVFRRGTPTLIVVGQGHATV